ncbi:MAG TPA: helix-turn-helix domain-containing protein [Chitinophagaceae bacterium]|jgi:AraC-like DNA-binding protein|nr:helix-turn-helix domain-containing protein [Chitinophagaceae bacterium]
MHYQPLPIPPALGGSVRAIWHLESPAAAAFTALADGCPGLLLTLSGATLSEEGGAPLPPALLYGQTTRPISLAAAGPFRMVVVYFYPSALPAVFGLDAGEWTDRCLDLNLVDDRSAAVLMEQLSGATGTAGLAEALSAFLLGQARRSRYVLPGAIPYALERIRATGGSLALPALLRELHLTERSFQRRFKEAVGIPPKLYARICRFQDTLHQLRRQQYALLSDIAYEKEYADQSHYIREFRSFAGCTPLQYHRRLLEAVPSLPLRTS